MSTSRLFALLFLTSGCVFISESHLETRLAEAPVTVSCPGNLYITGYLDADGDGLGDAASPLRDCELQPGYVRNADDCNDADPSAMQWATYFLDADGDGVGGLTETQGCGQPDGYVTESGDCNDQQPLQAPGLVEVCDGIDNDCDRATDDDVAYEGVEPLYFDGDRDGYGDPLDSEVACRLSPAYVPDAGDYNDDDAFVSPWREEVCGDGIDNDCNGLVDDCA